MRIETRARVNRIVTTQTTRIIAATIRRCRETVEGRGRRRWKTAGGIRAHHSLADAHAGDERKGNVLEHLQVGLDAANHLRGRVLNWRFFCPPTERQERETLLPKLVPRRRVPRRARESSTRSGGARQPILEVRAQARALSARRELSSAPAWRPRITQKCQQDYRPRSRAFSFFLRLPSQRLSVASH